ncbi:MAG TPA: TolC family protein, partial [Flavobacterium sp.]|nr:TolC family protein [Flavobacterium sp.]
MNNIALAAVLLLGFCKSSCQETSWSLQKCIETGLQNSIEIKIRQLDIKKTRKEHNSYINQLLPNVALTADQSYNFGSTINPSTNARVASNIQNDNFFLNANTSLIDFRALANAQKTKTAIALSEADLEVVANEYKLQILESYYQALYTQEWL